jgi:hypothetical protein
VCSSDLSANKLPAAPIPISHPPLIEARSIFDIHPFTLSPNSHFSILGLSSSIIVWSSKISDLDTPFVSRTFCNWLKFPLVIFFTFCLLLSPIMMVALSPKTVEWNIPPTFSFEVLPILRTC